MDCFFSFKRKSVLGVVFGGLMGGDVDGLSFDSRYTLLEWIYMDGSASMLAKERDNNVTDDKGCRQLCKLL